MNRPALTPTQRLVPLALAVMVGLVAVVLVYFGAAILMWAWGPFGLVPLGICVATVIAVAIRSTQQRRRD